VSYDSIVYLQEIEEAKQDLTSKGIKLWHHSSSLQVLFIIKFIDPLSHATDIDCIVFEWINCCSYLYYSS